MSDDIQENASSEKVDQEGINYSEAISYWNKVPPTVNGMLGGFGFISSVDIQGSEQFLKSIFKVSDHNLLFPSHRALDILCQLKLLYTFKQ